MIALFTAMIFHVLCVVCRSVTLLLCRASLLPGLRAGAFMLPHRAYVAVLRCIRGGHGALTTWHFSAQLPTPDFTEPFRLLLLMLFIMLFCAQHCFISGA